MSSKVTYHFVEDPEKNEQAEKAISDLIRILARQIVREYKQELLGEKHKNDLKERLEPTLQVIENK